MTLFCVGEYVVTPTHFHHMKSTLRFVIDRRALPFCSPPHPMHIDRVHSTPSIHRHYVLQLWLTHSHRISSKQYVSIQ